MATPFFEAVFALVSRAVLIGMKAACEASRLEKGGAAELNARVQEELACLFQSKQLGAGRNHGLRRGGTKVDVLGTGAEVESAQLAAKTEADIARLIKETKEIAAHVNQNFLQLEATIRKNAQEDSKSGADQTEKPSGPGGDGKDALAAA